MDFKILRPRLSNDPAKALKLKAVNHQEIISNRMDDTDLFQLTKKHTRRHITAKDQLFNKRVK